MPHHTRQAIARWTVTALLIVVLVYPLSYAPYLRFRYGKYKSTGLSHVGEVLVPNNSADFGNALYAPMDWLIDHTPLEKPL
jgi:hypothetical protein